MPVVHVSSQYRHRRFSCPNTQDMIRLLLVFMDWAEAQPSNNTHPILTLVFKTKRSSCLQSTGFEHRVTREWTYCDILPDGHAVGTTTGLAGVTGRRDVTLGFVDLNPRDEEGSTAAAVDTILDTEVEVWGTWCSCAAVSSASLLCDGRRG